MRNRGRRARPASRAPDRPRAPRAARLRAALCAGSSVEASMTSGRNSSICAAKYARKLAFVTTRTSTPLRSNARSVLGRPRSLPAAPELLRGTARCSASPKTLMRATARHSCPRAATPRRAAGWICHRRRAPDSRASSEPAECASTEPSARACSRCSSSARFSGESDSMVDRLGLRRLWPRPGAARSR